MKKKLILLIICLSCLCGCSIKYELTVNDDLSFNEEVKLYENKDFIRNNIDSDITKGVNKIIDTYKNNEDALGINLFNVTNIDDGNSTSVYYRLFKNYDDLDNYSSSALLNNYFKGISNNSNKKEYTIFLTDLNYSKIVEMTQKYQYKFTLDKVYLYITLPFEVKENNADIVDGNSYIWIFNNENSNRDIKLVFTSDKVKDNNEEKGNIFDNLISSAIDNMSGGKVDGNSWLSKYKFILYFSIILVTGIICAIIIRRKIKQANQI